MPEPDQLDPAVVKGSAGTISPVPLPDSDAAATTTMLSGLLADMAAMRRMNVGEREPATTYDASSS